MTNVIIRSVVHPLMCVTQVCRLYRPMLFVLVWRSGNGVRRINEVKLHRARLVPWLVTIFGGSAIPVFIQATHCTYPRWDGLVVGAYDATQAHSAWPSLRG